MVVRRSVTILVAGTLAFSGAAFAQTGPSGDPPARVGRLSYLQGTVSYHDAQADAWSPAAVNTPLTTGDSVWTEPNGHDELSISGTRVRMDGDTQLDVAALDDSQTRLQLDQGRLDIKTFALDTNQPYQIVTPRGIAALKDQGDYYLHAGTTADPTVMGVRSGAADFQAPNGQTVALHSGEEAQVTGDGDSIQIRKVETAPPPLPTYWAQRDQRINYAPVQYLGADVTGYEDLAAYGTWTNDPDYGEVWVPQAVAADWTPYSTGYWSYVDPYGWTWVDSAPWGFAPYHYGRWAHRDNRWFWVPPERREHAVYAPALVAFVGGTELGAAIGAQNRRPVGWFPLGPREAYVPPYTADRHYYQRINANARVPEAALNDRWQRAEHHEALRADQHNEQLANRRFATVVSADDFSRSRPVQQARLHVAADKIAAAPVAAVSAPPAPTMALAAQAAKPGQPQPQAQPVNRPGQPGQPAVAKTRFAAMETIARPAPNAAEQHHVPGPRITSTQPSAPTQGAKPNLPQLAPHGGNAPAPNQPHPNAAATPQVPAPNRPGEPPRPNEQHPGQPPQANQAVQPEHRPGEPPRPSGPPQAHQVQPQHPGQPLQPGETPHPQANQAVPPAHPGEPPRPNQQHPPQPPQVNHAVPAPHQPEPPHPQANHAVQPPHQPEPPHPQANVAPQHPAEPPHPAPQPQAHAPAPPPQHQAPPPQAHAPAPPPQMPHPAPQAQAPHPAPPPAPHPSAPPPQAPHPAPQQAQQPHPAPQSQQPQQQQKKPGEK